MRVGTQVYLPHIVNIIDRFYQFEQIQPVKVEFPIQTEQLVVLAVGSDYSVLFFSPNFLSLLSPATSTPIFFVETQRPASPVRR